MGGRGAIFTIRRGNPFARRLGPPLGFSLLAAAFCLLFLRHPGISAWQLRSSLVAAVGTDPLFDARLAGFRYTPRNQRPEHLPVVATRLAHAVGELGSDTRRYLRGSDSPRAQYLRGLTQLLLAHTATEGGMDLDRSISSLRSAVDSQPGETMFRSDLAAALWLRWKERGAVDDLLEALEHAEIAVEMSPALLEGRYNLTLVLESLNLWSQATDELRSYLDLDSQSPWAEVATRRLHRLNRLASRPREAEFEGLEVALAQGDFGAASRLIAEDPGGARDYAHDYLLPQWGEADLRGASPAGDPLAAAGIVAGALAEYCDDRMLLDALETISSESAARAYRAWGAAVPLLRRRAYEQALPFLTEIEEALSGSSEAPLISLVRYYDAVRDYQRGEYEAAMDSLAELAHRDDVAHYSGLLRKIRRMEGSIYHLWGHVQPAKERYLQAIDHAQRCGEREAVANDRLPLSVVLRAMGEEGLSQQTWWAAVQERAAVRRTDYLFLLFTVPVDLLLASDHRASARRFQAEAVDIAMVSGDSVVLSEALLKLAELLESEGAADEALVVLDQATTVIAQIDDPSVREFRQMEELTRRAAVLSTSDRGWASAALDDVVSRVQELGYRRILPRVLSARAALFRREGREEEEEAYLEAAVAEIERESMAVPELERRLGVLHEGRPIYDFLAKRAWRKGNYREALTIYDRARSIARLRVPPAPQDDPVPTLAEGEVLVAFGVLEDLTVAWWVRDGTVRGVELPLSPEGLEELLSHLGDDRRSGRATERTDPYLSALSRSLFEGADLGAVRRLRIVTYRTFESVPFSALPDDDDRPLVERYEIVLHPYLPYRGPNSTTASAPTAVLAFGNPEFSQSRYPELAPLPGTVVEASSVHRLYDSSSKLLLGGNATRAAVLDLLPRFPVAHFATHSATAPGQREQDRQRQLLVTQVAGLERSAGVSPSDFLSLDLSRVAVVVLATCETTTGELKGDGGLGFIPALLGAGAGAVVASSSPQGDGDATEMLITFHRYLARDGMPAAMALRQAKLDHRDVSGAWTTFEVFEGRI